MTRPIAIIAAAGPGMGTAIARRFAREGYAMGLIARDAARLKDHAAELAPLGVPVATASGDLCDLASLKAAFDSLHGTLGPASVLVYNGARWHEQAAMTLDPMVFNWDVALSATGALASAQHVYPLMKAAGAGTILFTGGGLALHPEYGAGVASLTAGKSALRGLTYALAKELAPEGIHVATVTIAGTVAPGTPFDPDRIADHYWRLHAQAPADWQVEVVFDGKEA
jgi:NAD(P)-dependent dehydrogenase (short-subunit alcohol dehydrogenase family)